MPGSDLRARRLCPSPRTRMTEAMSSTKRGSRPRFHSRYWQVLSCTGLENVLPLQHFLPLLRADIGLSAEWRPGPLSRCYC